MTPPQSPLTVWTPDATGEVRSNGNWWTVVEVEPGYETGSPIGQCVVQCPIIATVGGTPGDNEWGEELGFALGTIDDPDGVLDSMSGSILEPGDRSGSCDAISCTSFADVATTDDEGTAIVTLRLDDGNGTNDLIIPGVKSN